MFQLHSVVTSALFILFFSIVIINGNDKNNLHKDLPSTSDLVIYLKALKDIFSFCSKHKEDLDINLVFGLFISNVNLKKTLLDNRRRIPQPVQNFISLLIQENDDFINFFNNMVQEKYDPREKAYKIITTLFSNETQWLRQLRKLNSKVLKKTEMSKLSPTQMFLTSKKYRQGVDNVERWIPCPRISDICMVSLANNEIHTSTRSKCDVYAPCYDMLVNGTDFGYALTHRLLFLLIARLGRGCSIFSRQKDSDLMREYCTTAFDEARFIANNDYKVVDLILEQMCLCSMAGFGQFLKRSWLSDILSFQTEKGCFGQNPPSPEAIKTTLYRHPRSWKLVKHLDHNILGGECNGHVTSVAVATLALAVRNIYETDLYTEYNG